VQHFGLWIAEHTSCVIVPRCGAEIRLQGGPHVNR
jgi:hypothetical protein